jgi:DNA-binding SARP family transcriptional activator
MLLAVPNGRVFQEEIQVGFWPDTAPVRTRSNFDALMNRLHKTVEQNLAPIEVRRHLVLRHGIVYLELVGVDAHEFRRLAGKGMQQTATGDLWQAETSLRASPCATIRPTVA